MKPFNPNQPTITKTYRWATYVPDRRGKDFKLHTQANHGKSAFLYRKDAILYKWNEGTKQWDEVFKMEDFILPTCRHGGSWGSERSGHSYAKWFGDKRYGLCRDCYFGKDNPGI